MRQNKRSPLALGAIFTASTLAAGGPIPINNPSFEADPLANGTSQQGGTAWVFNPCGSVGVYNPPSDVLSPEAIDGQNVAYTARRFCGSSSVYQDLATNIEPNTRYTLTAWVGRHATATFPRAYGLLLYAGGNGFTPVGGGMHTPAPGTWELDVRVFESGPVVVDAPLRIYFDSIDTDINGNRNNATMYWDDFTLTSTPLDSCVCEADGDDLAVTSNDLLAYLSLWFQLDPGADLVQPVGVDSTDLLEYLACWFPASAGVACP